MKHEQACGAIIVKYNQPTHQNNQNSQDAQNPSDHQTNSSLDGQVLLVHQQNDLWGFPKGHVEPGETEVETALREVKEETGLDIILDPTTRYSISYYIERLDVQKEVVLFLAHLADDAQKLSPQISEIAELRWVPFSEVESTLNFPEWKEAWRHFHAKLQS